MKRLCLLLLLAASPALAHGGAHEAEQGTPGWTLDPAILVPLLLSALVYGIGWLRLSRRSSAGRRELRRSGLLFAAGWTVLAASVVSPLHEGGERSFTLHMIEHELIMLIAALLLVASRPLAAMLWALPQGGRQALSGLGRTRWVSDPWRVATDPVFATALQAAVLIGWHMPALFDRALGHEGWHIAQHLSFLVSALLFWWAMAHSRQGRRGFGLSALCLFVTTLVGGLLGALMSFSASPWYAGYAAMGMSPIGLDPVEDQQLAGLIMWIPGGLVHAGAAVYFLYKWLKAGEARHAIPVA